jgi:hypothetical protein
MMMHGGISEHTMSSGFFPDVSPSFLAKGKRSERTGRENRKCGPKAVNGRVTLADP